MSSVGDLVVGTATTTGRSWTTTLRYVLLGWWVLVALAAVALGARPSTTAELLDDVAAGRVDAVEVVGVLPPGAQGWATQHVTWRDGPWLRETTVVLASADQVQEAGSSNPGVPVTTEAVEAQVRRLDPGVELRVSDGTPPSTQQLLGLAVPSWLALLGTASLLLALGLVVHGSEPWRATRWAWAWGILLTGPLGGLAFALFSGPLRPLPAPRPGARRLSGGWGFLLALVVGGLTFGIG